ncbi:MAG: RNA recognition motif domain-containing protein [Opitutales bacterium]
MPESLFVGNLPFSCTEEEVGDLFTPFGEVNSVKIILDRETGRSRGFAFVEMEAGHEEAMNQLNGSDFQGRPLKINQARPREERPFGGGGGGGGGPRGGGGGGRSFGGGGGGRSYGGGGGGSRSFDGGGRRGGGGGGYERRGGGGDGGRDRRDRRY